MSEHLAEYISRGTGIEVSAEQARAFIWGYVWWYNHTKELTTNQAAEYVGLSPTTIRKAVRDGELRAIYANGRVYRFVFSDLDAWLQNV